jgi:hypothetical protein
MLRKTVHQVDRFKSQPRSGLAFHLHSRQIHSHRHLIPRSAFQDSARLLLLHPAPLFEEKWDFGTQALVAEVGHPGGVIFT